VTGGAENYSLSGYGRVRYQVVVGLANFFDIDEIFR
jgi:hypothetical protein